MSDARGLQGNKTAAAEAASRPVLSQVNGPYIKWVPERPSGSEAEHEVGEGGSRCGSWTLRCLGRDTAGRLVVGFGSVTLPAMVALHRIVVCALAVGLLWATSLSVARHFTSQFIAAPPLPQVVGTCNYAYLEVQRQRDMHSACVRRQLGHCELELRTAAKAESARSLAEGLYNRQVAAALCSSAQPAALVSLYNRLVAATLCGSARSPSQPQPALASPSQP